MNVKKSSISQSKDSSLNECQELKRKKIIEKIALTLIFQYNKIFKEKNYDTKSLVSDLKENVTYNDIKNNSYDFLYTKIEVIIIKKLQAIKGVLKGMNYSHSISFLPVFGTNNNRSTQNYFASNKSICQGLSI